VNYSSDPIFAIDTTFVVDQRGTCQDLRWLFYVLQWARLDAVSKDSAVPGLDRNDTYSLRVPTPPKSEQMAVARWLDAELADLAGVTERIERQIALIREYRTRLTADVVTGKLDVRHVAPESPASVDGQAWSQEVEAAFADDEVEDIDHLDGEEDVDGGDG